MAVSKSAVLDLESGSSQYASISNASQTGLNLTGSSSWMLWVKPESLPTSGNRMTLISKYDGSGGGYETSIIRTGGGTLQIEVIIREDASTEDVITKNLSSIGLGFPSSSITNHHHIAVVADYSGGSLSLNVYVDGIDRTGSSSGSTTAIGTTTSEFAVGSRSGGSNYYDGLISDVKVFSSALTADEVLANMRHFRSPTGCEANIRLDNNFTDETSNGNDLTGNNSPTFDGTDLPFPTYGRTTRIYSIAGDGMVTKGGGNWDTVHDATDGDSADDTSSTFKVETSKAFGTGGNRTIKRVFIPFDTSVLDNGLVIVGGALGFVPSAFSGNPVVGLVRTTQSDPTNLVVGDYDQCGSVDSPTEGATRHTPDASDTTPNDLVNWMDLNSTGLDWIKQTTYTQLGLRQSRDLDDNDYSGSPVQEDSITINSSEAGGTNNDPFLDIVDDDQEDDGTTSDGTGGSGGSGIGGGGVDLGGGENVGEAEGGGSGGSSSPGASHFFTGILIE